MKKRVLVATLGTAPSVITEAIDHLLLRDINLTEVFIITTSDTETTLSLTILRHHISNYYKNNIKIEYRQVQSNHDILEKNSIWEFMDIIYTALENYNHNNYEVYVSIAGGRKTMSALMLLAVQIFGAKEIFHITTSDKTVISKGQLSYIEKIIDDIEKFNEALHPNPEKYKIVQLPFVGFFPLISDMINAFRNDSVKSEEIRMLIQSTFAKDNKINEYGEIFAGILEKIFDLIRKYYFDTKAEFF